MYNSDKFIYIDILKGYDTWKHLSCFNKDIEHIWDTGMNGGTVTYDIPNGGAPDWFNPRTFHKIGYSYCYPDNHPIQSDPRFNLAMDCYGHSTLAVVSAIYEYRKNILFEEIGCGMGNLVFYLSKLGFTNFHLIDDWSQISKKLLDQVMTAGGIKYTLNDKYTQAVVSNIVQCPTYFKFDQFGRDLIPDSLELFCSYGHMKPGHPMAGINIEEFFNKYNFTCLARDPYNMMYYFCRENKYEEFKDKLQRYVLTK